MIRRAAPALLALAASSARAVAAEPRAAWDPGRETTSPIASEIRPGSAPLGGDGVYGRFAGDFSVGLHGGVEAERGGGALVARAAAHYYYTAGVYAEYADSAGMNDAVDRVVSFGVDVQPAFIPRWSADYEQGPAVLDLFVDSISLGLGAFFRQPAGDALGDVKGFEASLGTGVPFSSTVNGVWISARGLLRWDDPGSDRSRVAVGGLVTLGFRYVIPNAEP
jgi:hypothetical protein